MRWITRVSPYCWLAARIFLGTVYAYAGANKLLEPVENFQGLLFDYTILPHFLIPVIARVLPWIELLAGAFFILGFASRASALLLGLLSLGFFTVLLLSKWILGFSPESCGCFGEKGIQLTFYQVLILDFVNTVLGLKLFLRPSLCWSMDSWLKR